MLHLAKRLFCLDPLYIFLTDRTFAIADGNYDYIEVGREHVLFNSLKGKVNLIVSCRALFDMLVCESSVLDENNSGFSGYRGTHSTAKRAFSDYIGDLANEKIRQS